MSFDYNAYQRRFPYRNLTTGYRGYRYREPIPRIECADGFSFSVQADAYKYCAPRQHELPFYSHVEVGYPSERVESLTEYAEDSGDPTKTVYGYVPVEIVEAIVSEHGGMVMHTEPTP